MKKEIQRSKATAFGVLPKLSHSGDDIGIIRSVTADGQRPPAIVTDLNVPRAHPTAMWVVRCLQVKNAKEYQQVANDLAEITAKTQTDERLETHKSLFWTREYRNSRCSQVMVRIRDDRGRMLSEYDLYLTAGPNYSEQELPSGFFVDRQRNSHNPGQLTYYLNWEVMDGGLRRDALQGKMGFRVEARPGESENALAYYKTLDFQSNLDVLEKVLLPNETLMVDIELKRVVDATVFRISNDLKPGKIDPKPSKKRIP